MDDDTILSEGRRLKHDLLHLIYPLNSSFKTLGLVKRQELVFSGYDYDFGIWLDSIAKIVAQLSIDWNGLTEETNVDAVLLLLEAVMATGAYDARSRVLLLGISRKLKLKEPAYTILVETYALKELCEVSMDDSNEIVPQPSKWSRRKWILATAGVGISATACALSAGAAAPVVVPAVLSAVGLGGAAAMLTYTGAITIMASIFGVAGAGIAQFRLKSRFADIKDFMFIPLIKKEAGECLRVAIVVSGWLKRPTDTTLPWVNAYFQVLKDENLSSVLLQEVYCLAFEREIMQSLGSALQDFITSTAVYMAAAEVMKQAVSIAATSALMVPLAVLQAADIVDNPWTLAIDRAKKSGKALAYTLRKECHGRRPVTLIGYSLGALVILSCLMELCGIAMDENEEAKSEASTPVSPTMSIFGMIENVALMGLPAHLPSPSIWNTLRLLVAGRFIHCYSRNDWILKFMYRSSHLLTSEIAGLNPISEAPTIESVDLSNLIHGHLEYQAKLPEIIQLIGI